jgi:hypothetical protein
MKLDLLAAIGLTACAAVAISALAIGLGQSPTARVRLAALFFGWFLLVTGLAAADALHYQHGTGILGLGAAVVLPLAILFITGLRSAAAQRAMLAIPLWLLIGINSIRVLGVFFVILHAAGRLPAPFAPTAGWGDIVVGLTAGPLAWFAFRRMSLARPAIWIWNVIGLVDLIAAIGLGVTSSPGPLRLIFAEPGTSLMTTLPWLLIPGFLVPLLAWTHLVTFYRLAKDPIQRVSHVEQPDLRKVLSNQD